MKVLIVDDDEIMRRTLVRMLRTLGHEALEASSLVEAVAALPGAHAAIVDVWLEDGASGPYVLLAAAEHGVPAFLTSGGIQVPAGVAADRYLQKPFTTKELGETLNALFRTSPRAASDG